MVGGSADGKGGVAGEVGVKEATRVGGKQAPREGLQHLEHSHDMVEVMGGCQPCNRQLMTRRRYDLGLALA